MASIQKRQTPAGVRFNVRYSMPDGTQRSKSFTRHSEAKAYAATVETAHASGGLVDPRAGGEKFADTASEWHAGRVGLAPSTLAQHESLLRSLILPAFGNAPLASITPAQVRSWVADLTSRGLAPSTIRKAFTIFRSVLDLAVEDRKIARSPAAGRIELPKNQPEAMTVISGPQVAELAAQAGLFYRTHLLTAAQTGIRWGELAGLPISNVDFLRGEIHVRQQLTEVGGQLAITDRLKTPTSHRTVTIGRHQAELLAEHVGRFPNDHGLVFTGINGGLLRRSNFGRRILKPAATAIGVPALRFHDLRHTHASLLLAAGEPIPQVSKRLGHRNPATTLRLYAHALPGTERTAADAMDALFSAVPVPVAEAANGMEMGYNPTTNVADLAKTQ